MKSDFTVGIIGGKGSMGKSLEKFFKSKNVLTIVSDKEGNISNIDLVKHADIIVLSIPLFLYEKVLDEIKDSLTDDKMLMDIGSLKSAQVKQMRETFSGEILATHPLFGAEKNFSGKENNIIVHKINPGKKTDFILNMFIDNDLNIIELSPDKHDEIMAYIHGFYYLMNISYIEMLKEKFENLENIKNFETTSFGSYIKSLENVFNTNDSLIELIAYENPYIDRIKDKFLSALNKKANLKLIRAFLYK